MKSFKRIFTSLILSIALVLPSAVPTLAASADDVKSPESATNTEAVKPSAETRAGAVTWSGSGFGGRYTFVDYNLTPAKIMGSSGTLVITGHFTGNDGYADVSPIKLTAQIRSTSGAVKGSTVVVDDRSGATSFAMTCNVTKGEQIQLYFDASSIANPPGIYRSAYIEYDYAII